jgi:hypothetical protein
MEDHRSPDPECYHGLHQPSSGTSGADCERLRVYRSPQLSNRSLPNGLLPRTRSAAGLDIQDPHRSGPTKLSSLGTSVHGAVQLASFHLIHHKQILCTGRLPTKTGRFPRPAELHPINGVGSELNCHVRSHERRLHLAGVQPIRGLRPLSGRDTEARLPSSESVPSTLL